jgi:hypothetical protein
MTTCSGLTSTSYQRRIQSATVRLADLEMDDVPPLRLELARLGQHLEGGFGPDLAHAAG